MEREQVFFGSEIKALIAHPLFQSAMDMEGLLEYFTFQNFLSDRTLHKGVKLLSAGCRMKIKLEGSNRGQITRYWDYHFKEPDNPHDDEEYVEELDRLFQQAVRRQLVADVDVGSYLSGGMDSGAIRNELANKGIVLEDGAHGTSWKHG